MKVTKTDIDDVLLFQPTVYEDHRGFFFESFNQAIFDEALGEKVTFVQDNHSKSRQGVLRGIHYQVGRPQGKLVRVAQGEVFDVAVDLRKSSTTFGSWVGVILSAENKSQLWVPPGFGHAFFVLSETAEFLYKTTDFYFPEHERCIRWDDPDLKIKWPSDVKPVVSDKDSQGSLFNSAPVFESLFE